MIDKIQERIELIVDALIGILRQAFMTVVWLTIVLAIVKFWRTDISLKALSATFLGFMAFYGALIWFSLHRMSVKVGGTDD